MSKEKGDIFEDLTLLVYEKLLEHSADISLKRNVRVPGPDGKREIDILVQSKLADLQIRTAIECKNYKRKVDVDKIEAFAKKIQSLGIEKGIMISRVGFSSGARSSARRSNIGLYQFSNIENLLLSIKKKNPAYLHRVSIANVTMSSNIRVSEREFLEDNRDLQITNFLTDENLRQFENYIISQLSELKSSNITPVNFTRNVLFRDIFSLGGSSLKNAVITVYFRVDSFWGYYANSPQTVAKVNEDTGERIDIDISSAGLLKELTSLSKSSPPESFFAETRETHLYTMPPGLMEDGLRIETWFIPNPQQANTYGIDAKLFLGENQYPVNIVTKETGR